EGVGRVRESQFVIIVPLFVREQLQQEFCFHHGECIILAHFLLVFRVVKSWIICSPSALSSEASLRLLLADVNMKESFFLPSSRVSRFRSCLTQCWMIGKKPAWDTTSYFRLIVAPFDSWVAG